MVLVSGKWRSLEKSSLQRLRKNLDSFSRQYPISIGQKSYFFFNFWFQNYPYWADDTDFWLWLVLCSNQLTSIREVDQIQIYLYCTVLEVWWIASKLNWNFFVFLRSSVCYSPSYYMIITWLTLWENSFRRVLSSNLQARSFAPVYSTLNIVSAIKRLSKYCYQIYDNNYLRNL